MLFARGDGYSNGGPIKWTEETSEGNVTSEIAYGSDGGEVHFNFPGLIIDGPGWVKGYLSGDGRTWARATIEILPTSEMQKYLPGGGGSSSSSSASGAKKCHRDSGKYTEQCTDHIGAKYGPGKLVGGTTG